jgi:hypothetical protein
MLGSYNLKPTYLSLEDILVVIGQYKLFEGLTKLIAFRPVQTLDIYLDFGGQFHPYSVFSGFGLLTPFTGS